MPHIDYDSIATLDALIDVSDAGARASLARLRQRLDELDESLEQRVVFDGLHKKPTIAVFRGDDAVMHVYPEPSVGVGLHVSMPLRVSERPLLDLTGLDDTMAEAVMRGRPKHNVIWVDKILHTPSEVDAFTSLLARRIDLLPTRH